VRPVLRALRAGKLRGAQLARCGCAVPRRCNRADPRADSFALDVSILSIGACVAAIVCTFALSYGTDFLLQAIGLPIRPLSCTSAPLVVAIIFYRTIYNVIGGYIVARLAPGHPIGHALGIGTLGFLGSLAAAIATWNMNLGPAWYSLSIVALAVPSALVGARLLVASRTAKPGVTPASVTA
jgi:hypothetical protein